MKKSFFKKLSFVLALAMIVSVIAPAAGAFAAAKPAVNTSKKYLFLGESGKNEYDFNVKNKIKGSTYEWSSDNESVAVVDNLGYTTAKSVGTATISLLVTDKKGNTYPSEATVIVKDNIKSLAITNKPANDTLAVGAENDFNRSFTTQGGSTKKTTSVTRWVVTDADGKATDKATINNSGVFKATEAGTYKVTANAFQSTAKYDTWKTSGDSALIQATDTTTVTVKNSMTVAQTDLNTFVASFASAVTDTSKLSVYYLVGTTEIVLPASALTLSADGKTITVDMYSNLTAGTTYVVKYDDLDSQSFVAATSNVADVVKVGILTTTATVNSQTTVYPALYNANGVDILNGVTSNAISTLANRITMDSSNTTAASFSSPNLIMYSVGATTTITATFHTYNYDSTGTEIGALTGTGTVTCTDVTYNSVNGITAYTFDADAPGSFDNDFSSVNHTIAVDDSLYLYIKLSVYDTSDGTVADYNGIAGAGTYGYFTFASSNTNVLIVNTSTGLLTPVATGTANVIVYYTSYDSSTQTVVGAVPVTVSAVRKATSSTLSAYATTLSSNIVNGYVVSGSVVKADSTATALTDDAGVTLYSKDQYGTLYNPGYLTITGGFTTYPEGYTSALMTANIAKADYISDGYTAYISFSAKNGAPAGSYVYKVTVYDSYNGTYTYAYYTITVVAPSADSTVSYFKLEADASTYDTYITSSDYTRTATLSVVGYNSSGYKIIKVANQAISYTDPNGTTVSPATDANGTVSIALTSFPAGGAVAKAASGTWTAKVTINSKIYYTYFTVKDSTPSMTYTLNSLYSDEVTLSAALQNDCIDVYYNGSEVVIDSINAVDAGTNAYYVKYVTYVEDINNSTITHTLYINKTFYINQ